MADVGKTGYLSFNSVDLSAYVVSLDDPTEVSKQPATAFGSGAVLSEPGLPDGSLTVRLIQAWDTVDATLHAAQQAGTKAALAWRYNSGAIATTNPEFQVTAFVQSYRRSVQVGETLMCDVTFGFTSAVTRDVTP